MSKKWKPKELYLFLNSRYFRGRLPDIPVVWSAKRHNGRENRNMGATIFQWGKDGVLRPTKIVLNPQYKNAFVIWAGTLLHEMVHVQQWKLPREQAHGRKFQKRIKQLVAVGAYNGLL